MVPFKPEHLELICLQSKQQWIQEYIKEYPNYGEDLMAEGKAYTVMEEEDVLFTGGCLELHRGVGELWALLSSDAIARQGRFITRGIRNYLDMLQLVYDYHRLFTYVDTNFIEGHRWAELLGFHKEAVLKKHRPDKRDVALYVRLSDA